VEHLTIKMVYINYVLSHPLCFLLKKFGKMQNKLLKSGHPQGEERGRGIMCRHVHSLLKLVKMCDKI